MASPPELGPAKDVSPVKIKLFQENVTLVLAVAIQ